MDLKKKIAVLLGIHERPVSMFLKSIQGNLFVDLGANYGYYSLLLHNNFRKTYAFEPIPTIFKELETNLGRFDDVICVNKAASNTDGQEWGSDYHGIKGETETVTLASFFPNKKIDLIKMDVEGEEWKVLEGARPIINNIDSWVIELHDPKRKEDIEKWLISNGYSIRWLDFAYRGSKTANHIYAWRKNKQFSIVIPIKDEVDLVLQNLLSWYSLGSNDVILCLDKPADKDLLESIRKVYDLCNAKDVTKILEVEKDLDYDFHQAWVRRKGFLEAKHDKILTGDIDLLVYPSCLKAIKKLGKKNVGLVSLSKLRERKGLIGQLRNFMENLIRIYAKKLDPKVAGLDYFTGLYAVYRPYWLNSENLGSIKKLKNPSTAPLRPLKEDSSIGEDTHLRDWMIKKYECLYLSDIGAKVTRLGLEDSKKIQYKTGKKYVYEGKNIFYVLRHALIHGRPHVVVSYLKYRYAKIK
jgi:FkbM family methyltransferase